jgi:hypothetical protein
MPVIQIIETSFCPKFAVLEKISLGADAALKSSFPVGRANQGDLGHS